MALEHNCIYSHSAHCGISSIYLEWGMATWTHLAGTQKCQGSGQGLWSQLWCPWPLSGCSVPNSSHLFCFSHLCSNGCMPYAPTYPFWGVQRISDFWAFCTAHWLNIEMHRFSLLVHFSLWPLSTEMRPLCPHPWTHSDPESFHRPQTFCHSLPTLDSSHLPCTWVAVSCHLFRDIPDLFCCPCTPDTTVRTACLILQMCLSVSVPSGESRASGLMPWF